MLEMESSVMTSDSCELCAISSASSWLDLRSTDIHSNQPLNNIYNKYTGYWPQAQTVLEIATGLDTNGVSFSHDSFTNLDLAASPYWEHIE